MQRLSLWRWGLLCLVVAGVLAVVPLPLRRSLAVKRWERRLQVGQLAFGGLGASLLVAHVALGVWGRASDRRGVSGVPDGDAEATTAGPA